MENSRLARNVLLRGMLFVIAGLVLSGWLLSLLGELGWWNVVAFFTVFAVAFFLARRQGLAPADWRQGVIEPLMFRPILAVAALALLATVIYPPTMLDSLTYRLPRIWLWLQDHRVHYFLSADKRLDYMPQTWSLATLPLVKLAGVKLVWFWSFVAWIALYLVVYDWSWQLNGDAKKSRLLAFLAATSTFAVLQATSSANDLFAAAMILLALHFAVNFERTRDWREINWSVLAFCIAAGTKQSYAVFGLPLTLWFVAAPSRPWRAFRWGWMPGLLVVWLACSPLPSFIMNFSEYSSWTGPALKEVNMNSQPNWNVPAGLVEITWQTVQPPINPLALVYRERLDKFASDSILGKRVPRFSLDILPFSMVDNAGMGLVMSVLLAAGLIVACRRKSCGFRSWQVMAALAGLVSLLIAMRMFLPSSGGRAYSGFLYLIFLPLAVTGWNLTRPKALRWGMYLSLLSALSALVMNPSRPLWPAGWTKDFFQSSPRYARLARLMKPYFQVPERARTGEDLIKQILREPARGNRVVVVCGEDRPLLPLVRPSSPGNEILLLPFHSTPEDLEQLQTDYVVVGGGGEEFYPQVCRYLSKSDHYRLVLSQEYTSKLARGAETWKLYQRMVSTNELSRLDIETPSSLIKEEAP